MEVEKTLCVPMAWSEIQLHMTIILCRDLKRVIELISARLNKLKQRTWQKYIFRDCHTENMTKLFLLKMAQETRPILGEYLIILGNVAFASAENVCLVKQNFHLIIEKEAGTKKIFSCNLLSKIFYSEIRFSLPGLLLICLMIHCQL